MRYVQRDVLTGKIIGHFANAQEYASEQLADDHPDLLAFQAELELARGLSLAQQIAALTDRVVELERKTAFLP